MTELSTTIRFDFEKSPILKGALFWKGKFVQDLDWIESKVNLKVCMLKTLINYNYCSQVPVIYIVYSWSIHKYDRYTCVAKLLAHLTVSWSEITVIIKRLTHSSYIINFDWFRWEWSFFLLVEKLVQMSKYWSTLQFGLISYALLW